MQIVDHWQLVAGIHNDSVRGTRQTRKVDVTGKIARNGTGHAEHHGTGRVDNVVARTEVPPEALAAERHRIIVPWAALDGALHPHHAACGSISFQERNGCRVRSDEITQECVIPVTDDDSIIAEVNRRQVSGRKLGVSVPVSNDGVLKDGEPPRIVRLK